MILAVCTARNNDLKLIKISLAHERKKIHPVENLFSMSGSNNNVASLICARKENAALCVSSKLN
jgi:7-keto-8-aminopelargonate synthetase-like enzyme